MQPALTAKQMAEFDRETIESFGVPGVVLMENAGRGVIALIEEVLGPVAGKKIDIFCGKGNNGGDGYVVARHLVNAGAQVRVFLVGKKDEVRGDAATNLGIIEKMCGPLAEITATEHLGAATGAHLIVDALLGTGLQGEITGLMADVIDWINDNDAPVVAIDAPSGLNSDNGSILGRCVHATATATMASIKRGLLFYPGREHVGDLRVVDIGMPGALLKSDKIDTFLIEVADVASMLPSRAPNAYKNMFGTALVIAGSTGMTGAAVLSAETVLRAGAGLVHLAVPESLNGVIEEKATEVISKPVAESRPGHLGRGSIEQIEELMSSAQAVALGPGLGFDDETVEVVWGVVERCKLPLVIDADGLNALARKPKLLARKTGRIVLTPHPGELARLTGKPRAELTEDVVETARHWAVTWGEVLVVKGAPTVVGTPEGKVFINSSGNCGMATAGSGDVLTGIVTGLLAQGVTPSDAAVAGVYIHGLAGDIARDDLGDMGMIAGDIGSRVPGALKRIRECSG